MAIDPLTAVPDVFALAIASVAAIIDERERRVPNRLTLPAAALGVMLNVVIGGYLGGAAGAGIAFLAAAGGAAVGLAVFSLFAARGLVGMGDAKLVAALGAFVRWPLVLPLLLHVALAGGVVALVHALRQRRVAGVAMPYALAIAIGCAWTVASRYVEAVRLL